MAKTTLFWHDYETWGINPRKDRASQFAGIRTNLELEIIDEPVMLYCQPGPDFIPHPEAVLVTGITPQKAAAEGVSEADFFHRVNEQLSKPGTCGVGYNSIRFDDEVSRFGFYRNFIDPYAREWQNGNSRWDLLDLVRMTHALRPDGIEWPEREPGIPSFRLEHLTAANNIEHEGAHDALVDVRATIAIAKLIKEKQPRLYEFYFALRQKNKAAELLNLEKQKTVLHISGMIPASMGCVSPIVPLMQHPVNSNEFICFDLRQHPQQLLNASVEEIEYSLYTPNAERDDDSPRIALKGVHINKCPALAPTNTLTPELAEKWQINWDEIEQHKQLLLADSGLKAKLKALYSAPRDHGPVDADSALYNGFINNEDRKLCNFVINQSAERLAHENIAFSDPRLQTLLFRYRARNWPETLDQQEQWKWQEFCRARLIDGEFGCEFTANDFQDVMQDIAQRDLSDGQKVALQGLLDWVQGLQ
ncbi:exodeoxyribonuclease I [Leucothrix pacifica]|uniref:Exodeoxyribonuclease I n=1 Tax=Leucothrix pacifica TaxID=1247513 RepID=A0A317C3I8_9GAMM|nr:exodeoxyribonuclease I [Leucothrix pacifica]PWQ92839.1 exodeoxyribonuclease I [Leucothrix pacifica]